MNLQQLIPAFEWLRNYSFSYFKADLIGGITVWVLLVPQSMAYAMLMGLPPIYGLYGSLIPILIYGLLGTARQLSVGPAAITSLLVLDSINQLAVPESATFISLAILAGLLIGLVQFLMGVLKLGFLVNFLSHPIIIGFTSAAAVFIAASQLKNLLGIDIPRFDHLYETIFYVFEHIREVHWPSFFLCMGGIFLIIFFKKVSRSIPGALIVTVLGTLAVLFLNLDQMGVEIVGSVPGGLPALIWPQVDQIPWLSLLPMVFTLALIGMVECISIAKVLEAKHQGGEVRPNQELLALGLSKMLGSLFQALPTSGSFTRSAVNYDAGSKTGMASVITSLMIALTLIFFTPLFYYLPQAVLAAIILVAVQRIFNLKAAIYLWHTHRQDFFLMLITFIATLILGIEMGVLTGVLLSLVLIIYRTSRAHIAVLGQLPNSTHFRNVSRFKEAIQYDGVLIFRFDAQLFFCNVSYFRSTILKLVQNHDTGLHTFILDASSILDMDSSGLKALDEVIDFMQGRNIRFILTGVIGPVRDRLHQAGLTDKIGKENHFMYIQDAINALFHSNDQHSKTNWTPNAIQTNSTKVKK